MGSFFSFNFTNNRHLVISIISHKHDKINNLGKINFKVRGTHWAVIIKFTQKNG